MDIVLAGDRWIPEEAYHFIRSRVPIACVDVLLSPVEQPWRYGLIYRETYGGQHGWALVGGAVLKDEPLQAAVERHVAATLGEKLEIHEETIVLGAVVEYFTNPDVGKFHDPRKHAIALTYTASCEGEPRPRGEALRYETFELTDLDGLAFEFGQRDVVTGLLNRKIQSS